MTNPSTPPPPNLMPRMPLWAGAALLIVAGWFLTTHFLHIFSEAINWDEFALLARADRTLRLGEVVGGGRPGLVTLLLVPFVRGCIDSVRSVVHARIAWQLITLAYLAGTFWLVRGWFAQSRHERDGSVEGLLAVALLAFLPAFVTWSVQVRTDQVALAASIWGGALLLHSGRVRAAMAGALFAIAILSTQKAAYTIALSLLLFGTATLARIAHDPSKGAAELKGQVARIVISAVAAGIVLAVYFSFVPESARFASGAHVASAMDAMNWTRKSQGYRIYTVHATRLVVHWALFAALVVGTAWTVRKRLRSQYLLVGTSWLCLLLGAAVIRFHGSSFPYFLMTAGLFPSLALALPIGGLLTASGRSAWPILVSLIGMSALQSAHEAVEMLADTQRQQADTLRLIYDSPLRDRRGYQVEGALFCARDPDPLPALFSQDIWRRFVDAPDAEARKAQFVEEFRRRPVAYVVESYRLKQLPDPILTFLKEHYVWYAHSLFVAGFPVEPLRSPQTVDVIVTGDYRWEPWLDGGTTVLVVDGRRVESGQVVHLTLGSHSLVALGSGDGGRLLMADVPTMPADEFQSFYLTRQVIQLGGAR